MRPLGQLKKPPDVDGLFVRRFLMKKKGNNDEHMPCQVTACHLRVPSVALSLRDSLTISEIKSEIQ